jgi:hypothetical protein
MTEEKICPACGKPTAGYVPCPHCGADPKHRMSLKPAMIMCVIALCLGVVFFAMYVKTSTSPQPLLISDIDRWQDYNYVWIIGKITSGPSVSSTTLVFYIQDTSGANPLRVEVYDPEYKTLIAENRVPTVGDDATIFGQLRVYIDGSMELRVNKASDVTINNRAQAVPSSIQEVKDSWNTRQGLEYYRRVTLEATIVGLRPLSSAKIYTLEDNSGNTIEMYVHNGLMNINNKSFDFKLLQRVRVTAGASNYITTPQLVLADYGDIEEIGMQSPTPASLDNIDSTLVNQFVRVGGKVIFVEMVRASDSLAVESYNIWLDNQYNPRVSLDGDVYKLLSDNARQQLKRGAIVELTGIVSRYGSTFKINLLGPPDISLQSGTYEPPLVENFAAISSDNLDNLVKVEGKIIDDTPVFEGLLPVDHGFALQDNFGNNIKLFVTNTLYERMSYPPVVGDNVRVVGKVIQRESSMAVQPGMLSDMEEVS